MEAHKGGCQDYGPFFWVITLNIRRRIRIGIQKGTIILTTAHTGHMKPKLTGSTCPDPAARKRIPQNDTKLTTVGLL